MSVYIKSGSGNLVHSKIAHCLPIRISSVFLYNFGVSFKLCVCAEELLYVFHCACFVITIVCHNIVSFRNCNYEYDNGESKRK